MTPDEQAIEDELELYLDANDRDLEQAIRHVIRDKAKLAMLPSTGMHRLAAHCEPDIMAKYKQARVSDYS